MFHLLKFLPKRRNDERYLCCKGTSRFNTQLRDLGYNAQDIGGNATKLAAVIRYITLNTLQTFNFTYMPVAL